MTTRFIAVGVICIGLSACAEHSLLEGPGDASFGEANRQTMMAQVINPEPEYETDMQGNGQRTAAAVQRYREGKVTQPDGIRTTNVGNESSSSTTPD